MENKNQPAFPTGNSDRGIEYGLTKREYFAAMALQGFLSSTNWESKGYNKETAVNKSIELADEILKQLEKQ